jgi:hypothetical protein
MEQKEQSVKVRCARCLHFSYFDNEEGHNSPHALGSCKETPWDGNRGQWAMLEHPCRNFSSKAEM